MTQPHSVAYVWRANLWNHSDPLTPRGPWQVTEMSAGPVSIPTESVGPAPRPEGSCEGWNGVARETSEGLRGVGFLYYHRDVFCYCRFHCRRHRHVCGQTGTWGRQNRVRLRRLRLRSGKRRAVSASPDR